MDSQKKISRVEYSVYFVPMPIGNRSDITRRALEVLGAVDVVACEDTRHTGMLLKYYGLDKRLLSMHEHNETGRSREIAARAGAGEKFAIVTDAGMPGVSDPGYRLIQVLKEANISFTVLPGPSAVITALVGSGLPGDAFYFGGFLPIKSGRKSTLLTTAVEAKYTSVFYESPFRIVKTINALAEIDRDVPVCVARELTKTFETYHRGSAAELAEQFGITPPKGEIVLLIGGINAPRVSSAEKSE